MDEVGVKAFVALAALVAMVLLAALASAQGASNEERMRLHTDGLELCGRS